MRRSTISAYALGVVAFGVATRVSAALASAACSPALFGLCRVVGNLFGSRRAHLSRMRTIAGLLAGNALVLGAVVFTAPHAMAISINVFLVGTFVAIAPALKRCLLDAAGHAQTLAGALNHSAFNRANAIGAELGGTAIAKGFGLTSTGWAGTLLACGGMAIFVASVWQARHTRCASSAVAAL